MKAVVYKKYGPPYVLTITDISKPVPKDNEVLIRIHATSVTAGDWRMRKADPFLVRLFNGLLKPRKVKILGFELAGIIEETGSRVATFKNGDQVFASCGFKFGGYAEYRCLPVNDVIALKPSNISFAEAATVPIGGLTALRFLKKAGIKHGNNVLIYGASGSVGTFAIQVAKYYGASVTAVCSAANSELVTSIGADQVIDYTKEDFTKSGARYDIVFDAVGKTSRRDCKRLLKPGAKFVSVKGSAKAHPDEMLFLKQLIEGGKLRSVIDRSYTLDQIREAHEYVEKFHKRGNVAILVIP